jgi:hypothetical protein
MGFDVQAVVTLTRNPTNALLEALDHQFGAVRHEPGSKIVTVLEHVAMGDEGDAREFMRSLLVDAIPQGSTVSEITAVEG